MDDRIQCQSEFAPTHLVTDAAGPREGISFGGFIRPGATVICEDAGPGLGTQMRYTFKSTNDLALGTNRHIFQSDYLNIMPPPVCFRPSVP